MGKRLSTDAALRAQANDETISRNHIPTIADDQARALAWSARERNGVLERDDVALMLLDQATIVRRRGIEFAVEFTDIDLLEFLDGPDPDLTEITAFVLGERGGRPGSIAADDAELAALCSVASNHEDALCREAAVAALGAIAEHLDDDDPQKDLTRTVLWAALDDKATIRRRAVIALTPFDDAETTSRLNAARSDRDTQVRRIATALTNDQEPGDDDQRR